MSKDFQDDKDSELREVERRRAELLENKNVAPEEDPNDPVFATETWKTWVSFKITSQDLELARQHLAGLSTMIPRHLVSPDDIGYLNHLDRTLRKAKDVNDHNEIVFIQNLIFGEDLLKTSCSFVPLDGTLTFGKTRQQKWASRVKPPVDLSKSTSTPEKSGADVMPDAMPEPGPEDVGEKNT